MNVVSVPYPRHHAQIMLNIVLTKIHRCDITSHTIPPLIYHIRNSTNIFREAHTNL